MGRIFAIGDIHGRLTALNRLLDKLDIDRVEDEIVFLGDYIDRGPDSVGVLDRIISLEEHGHRVVPLKGNHEAMLAEFLMGHEVDRYLMNGGQAALDDYRRRDIDPLRDGLPWEHLALFGRMRFLHRARGAVFVHAGLRPGVELGDQSEHDLIWIRREFFDGPTDWPFTVVFGHTPFPEPLIRGDIIGLDIGAGYGGPITCLIWPDRVFVQS